jgi:hypothetical protein
MESRTVGPWRHAGALYLPSAPGVRFPAQDAKRSSHDDGDHSWQQAQRIP